jgi:hypothetical protein
MAFALTIMLLGDLSVSRYDVRDLGANNRTPQD